jgi:hypothetical protein
MTPRTDEPTDLPDEMPSIATLIYIILFLIGAMGIFALLFKI